MYTVREKIKFQRKHRISLLLRVQHFFCFTQTNKQKSSHVSVLSALAHLQWKFKKEVKKKTGHRQFNNSRPVTFGWGNRKCLCSTCEHGVKLNEVTKKQKPDAVPLLCDYSADLFFKLFGGDKLESGVLDQPWILTLNKDFHSKDVWGSQSGTCSREKREIFTSSLYRQELKRPSGTHWHTVVDTQTSNVQKYTCHHAFGVSMSVSFSIQ